MPRLVVGVLLLAAVGLLGPRTGSADEHGDEVHGHEHEHEDEHAHECPEGYEEHEGHCYYFSTEMETYSGAAAFCEAQDGRLAAPDCHDEHAAEFFYRTHAWISPDTEEDCGSGHHRPDDLLPFICEHAPTCDEAPFQPNTFMTGCEEPYDQQEICVYSCSPGYHLYEGTVSSAAATCLDGNWHGPFMACKPDCPELDLNEGVEKMGESCEAPYITGDICFFQCSDMQEPVEGDHDMSCLEGSWVHAATNSTGIPLVCP
ncbi:PREDICTED: uncharacterized protein LOC109487345 [Branchiostoma belcheri]|uniref:Uncharacterized protein LOC109487345 n=1 Tax=Branchiostoma belcheri TaxID=7741 RepID=A0A6P5AUW9_BRABE|nr:PREDICTED: uncharacterized protein LOC109487345 [Branchiostoma belcheri]